ncbi:CheY-like chemotaxis protein [Rhodoblastus acidophilus]|uniref:response regulator n=1 Tax=Rhodoblastus acidophilus TaxID=1074 RepID=UPI002224AF75|nr:response regulator [Rhodoblastus acidophilus]MCW2318747.1 CheY-like chemotaxis protein [Rhodoblastus acidophilus]
MAAKEKFTRGRAVRIVYIDDDELLLQVAAVLVSAEGHEIHCVNDPGEAVESVLAFRPDLVLLDVMMPGIDGLQVLAGLRQHSVLDRTPVAFTTADASPDEVETLMKAGAAGIIAKPFTPSQLCKELSRIFVRSLPA